jgi:hypothetical protein
MKDFKVYNEETQRGNSILNEGNEKKGNVSPQNDTLRPDFNPTPQGVPPETSQTQK